MQSERAKMRHELEAFGGARLGAGAVGYVLVVVRSLGDDRDPRIGCAGDSLSIRERGLSPRETRIALASALEALPNED